MAELPKKLIKKYAENIKEELKEDDLVWIHDYHLALVPGYLQAKKRSCGFDVLAYTLACLGGI